MTSFKYLRRVLTEGDNNWPEVEGNMRNARKIWMRMTKILIPERDYPKVSELFFKAVVQAVLILGAETWVLTPRVERALSSFQQRVARWLTGRQMRRRGEGRY